MPTPFSFDKKEGRAPPPSRPKMTKGPAVGTEATPAPEPVGAEATIAPKPVGAEVTPAPEAYEPFSIEVTSSKVGKIDEEALRVDPHVREVIEAEAGVSIDTIDPAVLKFVVDKSKTNGNEAFREKKYAEAIKLYTQAIAGAPTDHTLYSNRAAAYHGAGRYENSALDAARCVTIAPKWGKGYYRLGVAFAAMGRWEDAVENFTKGCKVDPRNSEMGKKLAEATKELEGYDDAVGDEAALERRGVVQKLRDARKADARAAVERSFKEAMIAPDWDPDDYEWRPTWLPSKRTTPVDKDRYEKDTRMKVMTRLVAEMFDLQAPKNSLLVAEDAPRVAAYDAACTAVLSARPGARCLCLEAGTGLLPLMCGRGGSGFVYAIARSKLLYRALRQTVSANIGSPGAERVRLIDRPVTACWVEGEDMPPGAEPAKPAKGGEAGDGSSSSDDDPAPIPVRADILVTDLVDHTGLGLGLLPTLDHAARKLLQPGGVVVPGAIRITGVLMEMRVGEVCGLDLSCMDTYRWHPQSERVDLSKAPHKALSQPFQVADINLQARADALTTAGRRGAPPAPPPLGPGEWEEDFEVEVEVTAPGVWNCVAFWFELDLGGGVTVASWAGPGGAATAGEPGAVPVGASWGQAVQYIDEIKVEEGRPQKLRVRRDGRQVVFTPMPPPKRARHAWLPRWHFDMVLDHERNSAYDKAICRAINSLKEAGHKAEVRGLDIGAGTGLLSMFAARAGADSVVAVEKSGHMADVCEECTVLNGYLGKIRLLQKDSRQLTAEDAEGKARDLEHKANLLMYEVFDSGLIGEGVLHLVAAAKENLLEPGAILVPQGATVYAQPISYRLEEVQGLDVAHLNRYRWRQDYEGVELRDLRGRWRALAEPVEVADLDFNNHVENLHPLRKEFAFKIAQAGVVNAIAFWFELRLDHETTLSTSPYVEKGATWQQAVQYVEEVRVEAGEELPMLGGHNTYQFEFRIDDRKMDLIGERRTGVPLWDPLWSTGAERFESTQKDIAKASASSPLEFREIAKRAVVLGSRPQDFGVDVDTAVRYASTMMM